MKKILFAAVVGGLVAMPALAAEKSMGEAVEKYGMEIAGIYLQAVMMEPHLASHDNTDIHIEADIKAAKGNSYGFAEGNWVPYLDVDYVLTKDGSAFKAEG